MKAFILFFSLLFFHACGSVYYNKLYDPLKDESKKNKLAQMLYEVSGNMNQSNELAFLAIKESRALANEYNLTSPPLYHNFLVNSGLRKRGLCFHFVEDLMKQIKQHNFSAFDFRWGRANGNKLNEHNVIVVLGNKEQNFQNGVILDAWRKSGELFFCKVKDDPKYHFIEWKEGDRRIK